ncbi:hypothetical protein MB02_07765 [Croceicoccus estronivorus]|uniref:TetR/AcrR family transcriptional regulator n=1 Tax=Croceicoccus estronivorus TaxID=1172626 RepID=UPI00082C868A|nr:TetR/AcrR family transcriptional regulator [Croceicoccus estronivorus]OCC24159.1 hypothetical protein MB02_07765 [Croceicoccus estronivorus]
MTRAIPCTPQDAASEQEQSSPARRPGRPKLLDRDRILNATLNMLEHDGLAAFTMSKLARRLGASVMTLYTYFPSREALLDDAAGRIFHSFDAPPDDLPWRDAVEAWLRALYDLFGRYPIGLRLIKWDGAVTPSWLDVWVPLLRILSRAGLSGESLIIGSNWVGRTSMALLMTRISSSEEAAAVEITAARNSHLDPKDLALVQELVRTIGDADTDAIYDFGIANIIRGLAELIPDDKPTTADV